MSVVAEPLLEQQLGEGVAESQVGQFFQINTRPQWPQRRQPFKWSGQCELAVKSVARSGSCSQTGRTPLAGLRELSSSVRGERCVEREVGGRWELHRIKSILSSQSLAASADLSSSSSSQL